MPEEILHMFRHDDVTVGAIHLSSDWTEMELSVSDMFPIWPRTNLSKAYQRLKTSSYVVYQRAIQVSLLLITNQLKGLCLVESNKVLFPSNTFGGGITAFITMLGTISSGKQGIFQTRAGPDLTDLSTVLQRRTVSLNYSNGISILCSNYFH